MSVDYGVEARFSDGSVWRRQSVGTRADAQEHLNLCERTEALGSTTSSRDPFTRLSFALVVRTSVWSNDWREADSADVILYCGHDWSLTGAEGPVVDLGRWPILWTCDVCGATVLDEWDWRR
ncbi:MAG: hypothetical protein K0R60_44 [Microbacterium sp.]|jgi:hypothetical protein|nr:hypothetical protein [Microbacterium sp.]